jgi:hypothetical protein
MTDIIQCVGVRCRDVLPDLMDHAVPLIVGRGGELRGPGTLIFELGQDAGRDSILLLGWQPLDRGPVSRLHRAQGSPEPVTPRKPGRFTQEQEALTLPSWPARPHRAMVAHGRHQIRSADGSQSDDPLF